MPSLESHVCPRFGFSHAGGFIGDDARPVATASQIAVWRSAAMRLVLGLAMLVVAGVGLASPAGAADDEFVSIFDGSTLDGWEGATSDYEVVDGAIQCKKGRGGNLYTTKQYSNFVVKLKFQLPPGGNNGLAIRFPGGNVNPAYAGMCELQVLDNEAPQYAKLDVRQYHGSAYGMAAAKRGHLKPAGEWNEQEVTVNGSTIVVVLNGVEILNTDLSKIDSYMADSPHPGKDRTEGHFGFAGHSDPVRFKDLSIRELD